MLAAFSAHRPILIGIFPINSGTHEGSVAPEAPRQLGEASEIKRLYTKSFVERCTWRTNVALRERGGAVARSLSGVSARCRTS